MLSFPKKVLIYICIILHCFLTGLETLVKRKKKKNTYVNTKWQNIYLCKRCHWRFPYLDALFYLFFSAPSFFSLSLFLFFPSLQMGLFKALDTIVHGGVGQPESYEKKKNYTFSEVLGN